jgi:hypothetical protein
MKVVGTSILKSWNGKSCVEKRKSLIFWIRLFKKKEKGGGEGRSQLGGQWKVPMLGGQWEEKEKEKYLVTFSHFPQ